MFVKDEWKNDGWDGAGKDRRGELTYHYGGMPAMVGLQVYHSREKRVDWDEE